LKKVRIAQWQFIVKPSHDPCAVFGSSSYFAKKSAPRMTSYLQVSD
jgi:hypothetical protein